jgi:hypothetical protein
LRGLLAVASPPIDQHDAEQRGDGLSMRATGAASFISDEIYHGIEYEKAVTALQSRTVLRDQRF